MKNQLWILFKPTLPLYLIWLFRWVGCHWVTLLYISLPSIYFQRPLVSGLYSPSSVVIIVFLLTRFQGLTIQAVSPPFRKLPFIQHCTHPRVKYFPVANPGQVLTYLVQSLWLRLGKRHHGGFNLGHALYAMATRATHTTTRRRTDRSNIIFSNRVRIPKASSIRVNKGWPQVMLFSSYSPANEKDVITLRFSK